MASPNEENEKEAEDEEFVDYHVTEEVRQAGLEIREPGNASHQKQHDTAITDSEAVMKQFEKWGNHRARSSTRFNASQNKVSVTCCQKYGNPL